MYTAYSMNVRKPGTTHEEYRSYLENTHVPLLMSLWGDNAPLRYTRSYTPTEGPGAIYMVPSASEANWQYDCITRLDWEDEAHFKRGTGIYFTKTQLIADDEAKFMDRDKTRFLVVGEGCFSERK